MKTKKGYWKCVQKLLPEGTVFLIVISIVGNIQKTIKEVSEVPISHTLGALSVFLMFTFIYLLIRGTITYKRQK